jgi:hypothetical protein
MTRSRRLLLILALVAALASCEQREAGVLQLTVVARDSGRETPARVEIRDPEGQTVVPDGALSIIDDCGKVPFHNWIPWIDVLQFSGTQEHEVLNPFTGTSQFYVDGAIRAELSPGQYRVTAYKGIEYRVASQSVTVETGATASVRLELSRWIDLPASGWYSADDHLHIPRPGPGFDVNISKWMQAEDIHVGNLLQMGLSRDVHITPQNDFGERSVFRDGDTLLVGGQENPRTHVLGHSIILGARRWIDLPRDYLSYDRYWEEAHEQGAANGYAHMGLGGAEEGLAVWAHRKLLDFIEVLNLDFPFYERWYEALNLGLRIAPTAGSDYPCLPTLPGRERFYTRLDGALDFRAWIEQVRAGRTFVTNGPILLFEIDGVGPGEAVAIEAPGTVHIHAEVHVDPERDKIERLELVRAGDVVDVVEPPGSGAGPASLTLDATLSVDISTWFAVRASGKKRGETRVESIEPLIDALDYPPRPTTAAVRETLARWGDRDLIRPAAAHTAPIYVTVEGTPPIGEQSRAKEVAQKWLSRLDTLERRFDGSRIGELAGFPGRGDGATLEDLQAGRQDLLRAIEIARDHYATFGSIR